MISWCTQGTTVYNNYHLVCAFFNCIIYHIVIKWFFLKVWITSGSLTDERKICWQTFNSLDAPDGYFSIIPKMISVIIFLSFLNNVDLWQWQNVFSQEGPKQSNSHRHYCLCFHYHGQHWVLQCVYLQVMSLVSTTLIHHICILKITLIVSH